MVGSHLLLRSSMILSARNGNRVIKFHYKDGILRTLDVSQLVMVTFYLCDINLFSNGRLFVGKIPRRE